MPNPAPSARYDSPWKAVLTHAFHDFMEFFFPQRCAKIDWTKPPRFLDKELAEISFGDVPHGRVADKLVQVCLLDGGLQWVLIQLPVAPAFLLLRTAGHRNELLIWHRQAARSCW